MESDTLNNRDYQFSFIRNSESFPYTKIDFSRVNLIKHFELPQLKWSIPKMSIDCNYIGAIGSLSNLYQAIYIWKFNKQTGEVTLREDLLYSNERKSISTSRDDLSLKKILTFDFIPTHNDLDNSITINSFVVVYPSKLIYYHLKSGNLITESKINFIEKNQKIISTNVSKEGRFYGISYENLILIYDIISAKLKYKIKVKSKLIYLREDYIFVITNEGKLLVKLLNQKINQIDIPFDDTWMSYELLDIDNINQILTCGISEKIDYFYYIGNKGLYKLNFQNYTESNGVNGAEKIISFEGLNISQIYSRIKGNCKQFMTTDYENIYFWSSEPLVKEKEIDLENINDNAVENYLNDKGEPINKKDHLISVYPIFPFTDIFVSFTNNIFIIIDEIRIHILSINAEQETENGNIPVDVSIWLNENFGSIQSYQFSSEGAALLIIVDDNNATLWSTITDQLITKWYNKSPQWYKTVKIAPESCDYSLISSKVNDSLIKIFDYTNGSEVTALTDFNCFSCNFSLNGKYFGAGCVNGKLIACVWNIEEDWSVKDIYYNSPDKEDNIMNVTVFILEDNIICCPENSDPLIFDIESTNLIKRLDLDIYFSFINIISSSSDEELFYIHGYSGEIQYAYIFHREESKQFMKFENCSSIQISENSQLIMVKLFNQKDSRDNGLFVYNLKGSRKKMEISEEDNFFLKDSHYICSYLFYENEKYFIFSDVFSGKIVAEITYKDLILDEKCALDIQIDEEEDGKLIIRRIVCKYKDAYSLEDN